MEKIKLLYLVSLEYSGSTLVALLLGSHKDIATVGELSGPNPNIKKEEHPCSCGSTTLECPFWRRIEERLAKKGINYSVFGQDKYWLCSNNRYIRYALTRPVKSKLIDGLQAAILKRLGRVKAFLKIRTLLIREIIEHYSASVFLDTDKETSQLQILRRHPDLDIKVLHLVRDGRGQFASQLRRGRDAVASAQRLAKYDISAMALKDIMTPDRYMLLKYEDICSDPKTYLGRIAEFAGLDPQGFPEGFRGEDLHVFGNPMIRNFTRDIIPDERWREELDKKDLALFEQIAGKRNELFDYS